MEENGAVKIGQSRKQLVAKRNDMIQKSRYSLNAVENKAVLYILSKVNPEDREGKIYEFNCREFYRLIRWEKQSYKDIRDMLQRIKSASWWINVDEEDVLMSWFDIVRANPKTEVIKISFSSDMNPYILQLARQRKEDGFFYTSYEFEKVALMKHQYSPRIYELLKSYQYNNQKWSFELGTGSIHDLQVLIAASSQEEDEDGIRRGRPVIPVGWANFYTFNRDVLKHAKKEINKYTDIKIEYEASKYDLQGKKHRRYSSIVFYMLEKTQGEKDYADKVIDSEYSEIGEDVAYRQMTLEDLFIQQHEEQVEREREEEEGRRKAAEERAEREREAEIEALPHPVFASEITGFTEQEMDALFSAALRHIEPGRVKLDMREMWVTDYVGYYYDYVRATPGDTKTTVYKRLLDMVRHDYEDVAGKISVYDRDRTRGVALDGKRKYKGTYGDGGKAEGEGAPRRKLAKEKIKELSRRFGEIGRDMGMLHGKV